MKRFLLLFSIGLFSFNPSSNSKPDPNDKNFPELLSNSSELPIINRLVDSIYHKINLDSLGLNRNAFFYAYKGYQFLLSKGMLSKTNILTVCDYSQSSHNKRLYVIDLAEGKILFNTYVSHGKNSGGEYATSFSNLMNSNKSSLGFLVTAETYTGKAGYSMHFDGVEPGINDKVRPREIVMHGSWYVNAQRADEGTMMGRSFGCPALAHCEYKQIIDAIKGGSCFFVFYPDSRYMHTSKVLNANFVWPNLSSAPTLPIMANAENATLSSGSMQ
ncbi:MAG: murein L,D-transpeptidase catalytic domain family protein [Chitinophagaceae bacterium]